MRDDLNITFRNDEWVIKNKLCVVWSPIDMSQNFCVTATEEWVRNNCPELLTKFTDFFLRYPDKYGDIYGRFGNEFLTYGEDNIGVLYVDYE